MDKSPRAAFVLDMSISILALLDGLGGPELLVIGLVVLLLFGSKRMPEIARGLGRAIREFKRATSSVEDNLREALYEEPARPKIRPPAQLRPHRTSPMLTVTPEPAEPPAAIESPQPALNPPVPPDAPGDAGETPSIAKPNASSDA